MAAKKSSVKKNRPSAAQSKSKKPVRSAGKTSKPARRGVVKAKPAKSLKVVKLAKAAAARRVSPVKAPVAKRLAAKAVPVKSMKNEKPGKNEKPAAKGKPAPSRPVAKPAVVVPPPKPVKPVPLKKADLDYFRALLLEKRREILGDVGSMESEAFKSGSNLSNMPIHMADVGTDNFEQEFTLGLIESERQILREIQAALGRLDDGTYGICLGTGEMIPRVRLEAVPWAKYTIEYSRKLEQGLIRDEAEAASGDDSDEDED
jgi:RNA polymerase-binding protein DksA